MRIAFLFAIVSGLLYSCQKDLGTENVNKEVQTLGFVSEKIPNQFIVVFDEEEGNGFRSAAKDYPSSQTMVADYAKSILEEYQITAEVSRVYSKTIKGFVATLDEVSLKKFEKDKRVKYVEQDQMFVMAPPPWAGGGDDGGGGSAGQEVPLGITRVNGGSTYTGNKAAWIVDTGIDLDHEDLNVDASRGFNAFTKGRDGKSLDDANGHGTHVAGTVAAIDNELGVVGVAAGATVIPVKVLDGNGSGSYSGVIAGIDFVGANGNTGDVANMSLGGGYSQAVNDAVIAATSGGVIFCVAAGNSGADANNYSPASANGPNIYTISAMDHSDVWASFSNFANPPVDYCAPGVSIKSTWKDGGYNTISGTSMASPHAAGVLLLGPARSGGTVSGDPDGTDDVIITH